MLTEWIWGLLGGLMIGSAGAIYLLANGRIMGASGIIAGLLRASPASLWRERAFFVFGLIAVPAILQVLMPVDTRTSSAPVLLIFAGLSVGLGTRLANGCTSGHGVCGISRLSWRGICATLIYIGAGILTVAALRLFWGAA